MLNPPFSVELTKQGMWTSVENPSVAVAVEFENQQQTLTAMTQDRTEATTAFLEKRPPSTSDSARRSVLLHLITETAVHAGPSTPSAGCSTAGNRSRSTPDRRDGTQKIQRVAPPGPTVATAYADRAVTR
jgi:hypothetical protein